MFMMYRNISVIRRLKKEKKGIMERTRGLSVLCIENAACKSEMHAHNGQLASHTKSNHKYVSNPFCFFFINLELFYWKP